MNGILTIYQRFKNQNLVRKNLRLAKQNLLKASDLTEEDKDLLRKVSIRIHSTDSMLKSYTKPRRAHHYLSVGLSASICIRKALKQMPENHEIKTVLDFPSGYGRVLRFLRVMFPNAEITAAEIDQKGLDFCSKAFSARTLLSNTDFSNLSGPQKFDLIWCGSLFTHIDEESAITLLQFFQNSLSDQGICVFTSHGQHSADRILYKNFSYNLSKESQEKLIQGFQSQGYGYANYKNSSNYGISIASYQKVNALTKSVGLSRKIFFSPQAWDNHQDVYAFAK